MLSQRLLDFSLMGAEWVLWLLVALSALSVAVMFDRFIFYFRTREQMEDLEPALKDALSAGDATKARELVGSDTFVRNILRVGIDHVAEGKLSAEAVEQAMVGAMAKERARYDARLTILATIGNNAPFIGLFGTVLGIIMAFHELGLATADQNAAQVVMGAISEALVATGVGIFVAIPAVAAYNWAKAHVGARGKYATSLMGALLAHHAHFPSQSSEKESS